MGANSNEAMREVLEAALQTIRGIIDGTLARRNQSVFDTRDQLKAALALPRRQCDVGTADEQDKRFTYQFCRVGIEGCIRCKLDTLKHRGNTCGIHWAQMPYEAANESEAK